MMGRCGSLFWGTKRFDGVDKRGLGNDGGDTGGDPPVGFGYSVSSFLFFCFGFFFFKQSLSFLTNAQSLGL